MAEEPLPRDEIDAEILDHLTMASARWQRAGCDPQEAQWRAGERFGDIETVRRRLWWIHEGEKVMWRALGVCLLVIVSFGLIALAYGGWRMQRSMDDRLAQLTDELNALNRTQRELLQREEPAPVLEIKGRAYLGDPSKPATGANIQICRMPETKEQNFLKVRSLTTDANGLFASGPLPPGDYYALAKLFPPPDIATLDTYYTQSRPYYLYPGIGRTDPADLDMQFHYGRIVIEGSRAMPLLVVREGAPQVDLGNPTADVVINPFRDGDRPDRDRGAIVLEVTMEPAVEHRLPWTPTQSEPPRWPLVGVAGRTGPWVVGADELPVERLSSPPVRDWSSHLFDGQDGHAPGWRVSTLSNAMDQRRSSHRQLKMINIEEGQTLRLRAEMPEDYESKLLELMSQDSNWPSQSQMRMDGESRRPIPPHVLFRPQPLELTVVEE